MAEAVAETGHHIEVAGTFARPRLSVLTLAALALALVALVLRLISLDREPLWLDEGYTLFFSSLPLGKLITVGGAHEHPPLYYLLVHAGLAIRSWYLIPRILSAVAGALAVPVIYLLGRRLQSPISGLVAAALFTVSPFHVWYGQDGRGYEVAGLLVLLSYLFLFTAVETGRRRDWVLYSVAVLLCLYTEYTTVFALAAQTLFLLKRPRPLLASWAGVAVGLAPWLGVLARNTAAVAGDYWIPTPRPADLINTALEFLGFSTPCSSTPCSGDRIPLVLGHEPAVALIGVGLVCLTALWAVMRRDFPLVLLSAWLLAPFAIVLALVTVRSLYLDRVFLDATYPLYLMAGIVAARTLQSPVRVLPAAAILLLWTTGNVAASGLVLREVANPDWRSVAHDLRSAYRPGQALIFNPAVLRTVVHAYLPAGWTATRERGLWSRSYIDVPGWQRFYPGARRTDKVTRSQIEAVLRTRQLASVARGKSQVWLVSFDYAGMNDTRRWFTAHGFQPILSQLYRGDTRLELWSRTGPSTAGTLVLTQSGPQTAWRREGKVVGRDVWRANGAARISGTFPVEPGRPYFVRLDYLAAPPAGPMASVQVFDRGGNLLDTFPRTMWYELPIAGVWLQQPFGFVAPPGASRAELVLGTRWGQAEYRDVAVFRGP